MNDVKKCPRCKARYTAICSMCGYVDPVKPEEMNDERGHEEWTEYDAAKPETAPTDTSKWILYEDVY